MIGYAPGTSIAHRWDPRTGIALQFAFVAAAYAHTRPDSLAILTAVALVVVGLAGVDPLRLVFELRYLIGFLALAPALAGAHLGGFDMDAARVSGLAAYRVLLIVIVSLAIVRTTPPRDAQAALSWAIPGRPGRALGTGVALVFAALPMIIHEARRTRLAMRARHASHRSAIDRIEILGVTVLVRTLRRGDRFALALRARCLSWNPTLPVLRFGRYDVPALAGAIVLGMWALV